MRVTPDANRCPLRWWDDPAPLGGVPRSLFPDMRNFRSPDGIFWKVDVDLPGSSNAMVIFRHPNGRSARLDRYNWFISHGPEARSVTSRLTPKNVLQSLSDADLARLFRRSMPISRPDSLLPSQASDG